MKIMILSDALNVIGNAFCIFYLGWDVRGVAIPTVISRIAAAVIVLYYLIDDDYKLHVKKTLKHEFDVKILKKAWKLEYHLALKTDSSNWEEYFF